MLSHGAVIRDVDLLVRVEGLRVVLQTLADGPHDFSPFLAMAFLSVFDRPGTRGWLRGGIDIEVRLVVPELVTRRVNSNQSTSSVLDRIGKFH